AYTDIPQLIAAIKNAGQTQMVAKSAPMTLPRRPATKEIKIEAKAGAITIAKAETTDTVKTASAGVSKNEAMLEEIWREHTAPEQNQTVATQAGQAAPVMASALTNTTQAAGLVSPVVQNEIAKATASKPQGSGERSHGFDGNEE